MRPMNEIEVDHVFVFSARNAPEGDELVAAGFAEGSPNRHAGQGTACRRFFFANGMVELLYVVDLDLTRTGTAKPTCLAERWTGQDSGASPFGLCFRPVSGVNIAPPFPTWVYGPRYLPGGVPAYEISQRCNQVAEPFIFYTPAFSSPDQYPPERSQPLEHPCGARKITSITLESPVGPTPDLETASRLRDFNMTQTQRHHMLVELDNGRQNRSLTLTSLPLSLHW
jgi:hypothetical protein